MFLAADWDSAAPGRSAAGHGRGGPGRSGGPDHPPDHCHERTITVTARAAAAAQRRRRADRRPAAGRRAVTGGGQARDPAPPPGGGPDSDGPGDSDATLPLSSASGPAPRIVTVRPRHWHSEWPAGDHRRPRFRRRIAGRRRLYSAPRLACQSQCHSVSQCQVCGRRRRRDSSRPAAAVSRSHRGAGHCSTVPPAVSSPSPSESFRAILQLHPTLPGLQRRPGRATGLTRSLSLSPSGTESRPRRRANRSHDAGPRALRRRRREASPRRLAVTNTASGPGGRTRRRRRPGRARRPTGRAASKRRAARARLVPRQPGDRPAGPGGPGRWQWARGFRRGRRGWRRCGRCCRARGAARRPPPTAARCRRGSLRRVCV